MTKEERAAAEADEAWRKTTLQCAYDRVGAALDRAGMACGHQGGLVVTIADPNGDPVRYFLRLTEVRA